MLEANALPLAYGQLLSIGRMEILHRLAAFHARQQQAAAKPAAVDHGIVQKLFGEGLGSETIKLS